MGKETDLLGNIAFRLKGLEGAITQLAENQKAIAGSVEKNYMLHRKAAGASAALTEGLKEALNNIERLTARVDQFEQFIGVRESDGETAEEEETGLH